MHAKRAWSHSDVRMEWTLGMEQEMKEAKYRDVASMVVAARRVLAKDGVPRPPDGLVALLAVCMASEWRIAERVDPAPFAVGSTTWSTCATEGVVQCAEGCRFLVLDGIWIPGRRDFGAVVIEFDAQGRMTRPYASITDDYTLAMARKRSCKMLKPIALTHEQSIVSFACTADHEGEFRTSDVNKLLDRHPEHRVLSTVMAHVPLLYNKLFRRCRQMYEVHAVGEFVKRFAQDVVPFDESLRMFVREIGYLDDWRAVLEDVGQSFKQQVNKYLGTAGHNKEVGKVKMFWLRMYVNAARKAEERAKTLSETDRLFLYSRGCACDTSTTSLS